MTAFTVFAPAKINLFLAVVGRRPDGFHDLVSVVSPLAWGDEMAVEPDAAAGAFRLRCDDPAVPSGEDNLVLKAARAFAAATGWRAGAGFDLKKRIPMAAGLGGGSSDAVAALRALNELAGRPLAAPALASLAASLGSDCAFFLAGGPAVMRGRGERIEPLPAGAAARLAGRRVVIFKPGFGIATPWAYGRLAADGAAYASAAEAEARLAAWRANASAPVEAILGNSFERPIFAKHAALPALFGRLRARFGLEARLSGSGSACFALLPESGGPAAEAVAESIREAWGASALVVDTRLAPKVPV